VIEMSRSRRFASTAAFVLIAAATAAVVVVVAETGGSATTHAEYVARVNAICVDYGKKLDAIPPPGDLSSPGAVVESLEQAIPILEDQADEIRALRHPSKDRADVAELHRLTDESLAHLQEALDQAQERALYPMAVALTSFGEARDEAKVVSRRLGFEC
jgi:hypothetical protein